MKYVYFKKAGKYNALENAFLTSRLRFKSLNAQYNHRNDYETVFRIPRDFFKSNFKYEVYSGVYRTKLTYSDLLPYTKVVCFKKEY